MADHRPVPRQDRRQSQAGDGGGLTVIKESPAGAMLMGMGQPRKPYDPAYYAARLREAAARLRTIEGGPSSSAHLAGRLERRASAILRPQHPHDRSGVDT